MKTGGNYLLLHCGYLVKTHEVSCENGRGFFAYLCVNLEENLYIPCEKEQKEYNSSHLLRWQDFCEEPEYILSIACENVRKCSREYKHPPL